MEKSLESEVVDTQPHTSNVGQQLRLAREAKRWSVADVARAINLSEQQVLELENDNYHSFPALVYVRGFVRSYARLVGLAEKEILCALDQSEFVARNSKAIEPHLDYEHYRPAFNHRRWLPWINGLIAVVLIALVLLWLSEKSNSKKTTSIATETTTTLPIDAAKQPDAVKPADVDKTADDNN